MRVAIVGGGASGLITAYLLRDQHATVVFEQAPVLEVNSQYRHIGVITVSGPDASKMDGAIREKLRVRACEIGGDLVSPSASPSTADAQTAQFNVYRDQGR